MNPDRVKQLEKFLQEDPNDAFSKYALALEYLPTNKLKTEELFDDLLKNHPDYIGTYYHAAALHAELGNLEKAEAIYQTGIEKAQVLKESHALRELQTAFTNFQFEND
ncbi:tetratricopeptide repeat protein [Marinoscillum pacificum]|uniref:tetratricopeptide repeat protein n=1 Tax=Marinoscillum pacificum TaxID=392723 RepID=UPI00215742C8|nr:tetratricopeptide repeat protein [Marinoscillum pacificum]